ncbi:MAG TPA: NUDIX pyrophosphatase [Rhodothermales bacterium]|nr:NUDIX pyrophosphatase [Rhodothermales bacterium]
MPDITVRVIDVYPYRFVEQGAEFLLLQRAADVAYAGTWRMVGGKIEPGETAWQAAVRELREETGRTPRRLWALPSANVFYEWEHDRINVAPSFAAELDADPVLDREHDAFVWLPVDEAVHRLAWPEQQRLARLAYQLLRNGVPQELTILGPDTS